MDSPKQMALEAIQALPDDCDWAKIRYQMYVLHHIWEGERDIEAGNFIPHEQVMRETEAWLLSLGQAEPANNSINTPATSVKIPSIER